MPCSDFNRVGTVQAFCFWFVFLFCGCPPIICVMAEVEAFLDLCTKVQLLRIADHYVVGDKRLKENVKAILKANLYDILIPPKPSLVPIHMAEVTPQASLSESKYPFVPVDGITLILGNDLDGERVWACLMIQVNGTCHGAPAYGPG